MSGHFISNPFPNNYIQYVNTYKYYSIKLIYYDTFIHIHNSYLFVF